MAFLHLVACQFYSFSKAYLGDSFYKRLDTLIGTFHTHVHALLDKND